MGLQQSEWCGHPRGLPVLFSTELWERFSFYGMKALLVLYLTSGALHEERFSNVIGSGLVTSIFGQPSEGLADAVSGEDTPQWRAEEQALASQLNEWYSGMAYLTPLLGGVLADRVLGARASVVIGGSLMAAGHACMASERYFLVGLLLLVFGNGGFKPNISAQLGALYEPTEMRGKRDRGFAIFYVGINLGALLAPLVCGSLRQAAGFHAGFAAAAGGMVLGLAIFLLGLPLLPLPPPKPPPESSPCCFLDGEVSEARRELLCRSAALFGVSSLVIPFWVAYDQHSNTLPLFFRDLTDRSVLGFTVPPEWMQVGVGRVEERGRVDEWRGVRSG